MTSGADIKVTTISDKLKSQVQEPDPSKWPLELSNLFYTFKALCTVYTFLSIHKHTAPLIHTLQASVSSMTKRPLETSDLAKIKALCPQLVHFGYVQSLRLQEAQSSKRRRREDAYQPQRPMDDYILTFEFLDRDNSSDKATSRRYVASSKPRQEAAQELISRRTNTFARAMQGWVDQHCQNDPVECLHSKSQSFMPTPPKKNIPPTCTRSSIKSILETISHVSWWRDQIVPGGRRTFPAKLAQFAQTEPPLDQEMMDALQDTHGIQQLYSHQAAALTHIQRGKHVVVSTSTSSGKSLVYQVPIAHALAQDPNATALCIFPTKALTQDQLSSLSRLLRHHNGIKDAEAYTYDGDTPADERGSIRTRARVLFTNPDMLHQAILPHEEKWRRFLKGLRVVVLDELHVYTGIFGTHTSLILRRLRRLCAALGNELLQFVSCSATISEPKEHLKQLLGMDVGEIEEVGNDGAPCGPKEWVLWNPPLIDPHDPSHGRMSAYNEVSQLFRHLLSNGVRTIVFAKVRRTCEIITRKVRDDFLHDGRPDLAHRVHAYRSGYAPSDRRQLEYDMAHGHVMGLIATSALELGVDIGVLDAVILFGVPYSSASMRQQAGRAGRRQKESLVILLGEPFPVDQYYMRNPELVFQPPMTKLWIEPSNELILEAHIRCAAFEMPFSPSDSRFFGEAGWTIAQRVCFSDKAGYYQVQDTESPALSIPIRGARQDTYQYIDVMIGQLLEEVEIERVYFEAYEGAVFIHQGITYICQSVHHDMRVVYLARTQVQYYTRPRDLTDIDPCEVWRMRTLKHNDMYAYYGRVDVIFRVWGYFKVDWRANILDTVDIDAEPFVRPTHGVWIDVPWHIVEKLTEHDILAPAAIHAAEHAILNLTSLFVASSADDVRTECKISLRELSGHKTQRLRPSRLIFYDKPGQNAGVCAQVFEHLSSLLQMALHEMESCECTDGCPECIEAPTCRHGNLVSSKRGALAVLRSLLHRPLFDNEDTLPTRQSDLEALSHTLCEPEPVPRRKGTQIEHIIEEPRDEHDKRPNCMDHVGSSLFFEDV